MSAVMLAAFLGACGGPVIGSGDLVTEDYDFTEFTRIEVSHAFEVEVSQGEQYAVSITVDDNLVDRLRVEQDGDTVRIGFQPGIDFGTATRRATLVLPRLSSLQLSGASRANVVGFASDEDSELTLSGASSATLREIRTRQFDTRVSGASRVNGDLQTQDLRLEVSGASQVELRGEGEDATIEASGASRLRLFAFTLRDADVRLSGASNGEVDVRRSLSIDVSGASQLEYDGDPRLRRVESSGASQIRQRGR